MAVGTHDAPEDFWKLRIGFDETRIIEGLFRGVRGKIGGMLAECVDKIGGLGPGRRSGI